MGAMSFTSHHRVVTVATDKFDRLFKKDFF